VRADVWIRLIEDSERAKSTNAARLSSLRCESSKRTLDHQIPAAPGSSFPSTDAQITRSMGICNINRHASIIFSIAYAIAQDNIAG